MKSRSDPPPSGANFLHRGARENIGFNGQIAQKIHLLKRIHFLPRCFFYGFGQPGKTNAGPVNEHVICIRIHRIEETQRGIKFLCQKRCVPRPGERTLREIPWNKDGTDGERFATCFSQLLLSTWLNELVFFFADDEYWTRRGAHDSLSRAADAQMPPTGIAVVAIMIRSTSRSLAALVISLGACPVRTANATEFRRSRELAARAANSAFAAVMSSSSCAKTSTASDVPAMTVSGSTTCSRTILHRNCSANRNAY
jgi:hypothetical protein